MLPLPQWQDEQGPSAGGSNASYPQMLPPPPSYQQPAAGPSSWAPPSYHAPAPGPGRPGELGPILCHCGLPSKMLRSTKENENKDRAFHVCDKGQHGGGCTFFQWGAPASSSGGFGVPSTSTPANVCYQCGQAGHFAAQCPNASRSR